MRIELIEKAIHEIQAAIRYNEEWV
jgi:hypothetical protein